jgi:DNA-binding PadR family transcriptional regulator
LVWGANRRRIIVLPGSLDMLISKTRSRGSLHGYGIVRSLRQTSGDEILVEKGSLYPALPRVELNGWIDGDWASAAAGGAAELPSHAR